MVLVGYLIYLRHIIQVFTKVQKKFELSNKNQLKIHVVIVINMIVNRDHWLVCNLLEDYFDADLNAVAISLLQVTPHTSSSSVIALMVN